MDTSAGAVPCVLCGLAPAATFPVRRHVGLVLFMEFVRAEERLCREHGRALVASYQRKTLLQGWWGLISVFVNVFVVFSNVIAWRRYSRLAPPSGLPWANRPGGVPDADADGKRPPAWHPDPTGRHEERWYDGAGWTARVRDGEAVTFDAIVPR